MTDQSVWMGVTLVVFFGAMGAMIRYGAGLLALRITGKARRGIIVINIVGAGIAGYLLTADGTWGTLIAIGLLGSVTTFSTIAVWVADDIRRREPLAAVGMILSHLLIGLPAVLGGFLLGSVFS
jgi:fluoride ion exporter CrcB/FEX